MGQSIGGLGEILFKRSYIKLRTVKWLIASQTKHGGRKSLVRGNGMCWEKKFGTLEELNEG